MKLLIIGMLVILYVIAKNILYNLKKKEKEYSGLRRIRLFNSAIINVSIGIQAILLTVTLVKDNVSVLYYPFIVVSVLVIVIGFIDIVFYLKSDLSDIDEIGGIRDLLEGDE